MKDKIASGRWILTVICGVVFGVCAIKQILPADVTSTILVSVFISYFQRNDRNGATPHA